MRRPDVRARTDAGLARPETREKIAASKRGERNPMFGREVSEETRAKRRASMGEKQTGEQNPAFKGEDAGVRAIHRWLTRRYPLTGVCTECREEKATERAFLRWPQPYTRDPDDYAEMCRKCHMAYDRSTGERP